MPVPGPTRIVVAGLSIILIRARSEKDDYPLAIGRVDLLTVITHELGHVLGLHDIDANHPSDNVMNHRLSTGTRRLPQPVDVDALFSDEQSLDDVLLFQI